MFSPEWCHAQINCCIWVFYLLLLIKTFLPFFQVRAMALQNSCACPCLRAVVPNCMFPIFPCSTHLTALISGTVKHIWFSQEHCNQTLMRCVLSKDWWKLWKIGGSRSRIEIRCLRGLLRGCTFVYNKTTLPRVLLSLERIWLESGLRILAIGLNFAMFCHLFLINV